MHAALAESRVLREELNTQAEELRKAKELLSRVMRMTEDDCEKVADDIASFFQPNHVIGGRRDP
jgi:hypothetical protein